MVINSLQLEKWSIHLAQGLNPEPENVFSAILVLLCQAYI